MTTKVTVLNHGPSPVQVKVMDRRHIDRFPVVHDQRVALLESKYRGSPLLPGETQEHYVHGDQELAIVELQADLITPTEAHVR